MLLKEKREPRHRSCFVGLTRNELFRALHAVEDGPNLNKFTEVAYKKSELARLSEPYFVSSFFASDFPGPEEYGRCLIYKLLNLPQDQVSITPKGRAIMEIGSAVEHQIVERWNDLGILIVPNYPNQMKIENEDLWLSGYIDAVLDLRPDWDSVMPVEIKSKSNDVIEQMKVGAKSYDQKHYNQLQAYMFYCNMHHERYWDMTGLKPAKGGIIYYSSRENPRNTCQFYVDFDADLINSALEKLYTWKNYFINDILPVRPKGQRWTLPPCQWCNTKKICKADYQEEIVKISESNAVRLAKELDPSYNLDQIKERVYNRWTHKQLELF